MTREGVFAPELRPIEIQICRKELRPTASRCYKQFSPKHLSRAPSQSSLASAANFAATENAPGEILGVSDPPP